MRHCIIIAGLLVAMSLAAPASAKLVTHPACSSLHCRAVSQKHNLHHARYLCNYGRHATRRWGCQAVQWLTKELKKTQRRLHPWGMMPVRQYVEQYHPCLAGIIARENQSYDPTLDFGGGHGNVNEAYGIPQATPGTKMASAGPDWRTNPWTQLKWMIGYTVGRYGSECAALYSRVHNNMY